MGLLRYILFILVIYFFPFIMGDSPSIGTASGTTIGPGSPWYGTPSGYTPSNLTFPFNLVSEAELEELYTSHLIQ